MIKLFRKIRQSLLNEGKNSKYLKYAVGEIVLVVIGILIALSINNWNENRKQNETLNSIYQIIKEDITIDIVEIKSFVENYETVRKPAFEAVLFENPSKEEWIKHPEYISVWSGFKDFSINQRGFDLLKNQSVEISTSEQSLGSKINLFYNQHLTEIDVATQEMMREMSNNNNDRKQLPWFSSYLLKKIGTEDAIDYIINDPIEKNRIALYYNVYDIYVQELKRFKTNGDEIIKQIDTIIK